MQAEAQLRAQQSAGEKMGVGPRLWRPVLALPQAQTYALAPARAQQPLLRHSPPPVLSSAATTRRGAGAPLSARQVGQVSRGAGAAEDMAAS